MCEEKGDPRRFCSVPRGLGGGLGGWVFGVWGFGVLGLGFWQLSTAFPGFGISSIDPGLGSLQSWGQLPFRVPAL